jgi:exodeoxyribonuclease VII large subunit
VEPLSNILTVSELNTKIKKLLEENFRFINIIGEISNFKIHSQSGHFYFTLKDQDSQIQAVMWKTRNQSLFFTPSDGMQVVVKGRVTVFNARGTYQIEVWEMRVQGAGELQLKFEKLKQKLFEEGLFDEAHKKPIPQYPEQVAIITSPTGAALQDFINIVKRRYPILKLYLFPVNVQGITASGFMIQAIKEIEKISKKDTIGAIDVMVIARGGGSLEDLFPFNDEKLARTIYSCKIPVVSAVGHEIDFTICDFVADLRAPTPSTAAELITPNINDLIVNLAKYSYFYGSFIQNKISTLKNSLGEIEGSYYFNRPKDIINNFYQRLDELSKLLSNYTNNKLSSYKQNLKSYKQTLHHISPLNNIKKGYALVYKNDLITAEEAYQPMLDFKKLVTRANQLKKDDDVDIRFYDDKKEAKIIK